MAIDFKKLRENAAKNDAETTKQYYDKMGKGVVRDLTEGEKADLRTATEKSAGNIRAFGGTGMGQQTLTDNEKTARDQNALNIMADSGLQRFMAGFGEGLTPFKDKADYSTPQAQAAKDLWQNSTEGKVGRVAGTAAQYLVPYGATEAVAAKVIGKALPNASKATALLAQNALQDATVGLGLNAANIYVKEGKRGNEALKDLAVQEAVDLGVGLAVSKLIGITLKSGKTLTKENIASLSDDEVKEAVKSLPKGEKESAEAELRRLARESNERKAARRGETFSEGSAEPLYDKEGNIVNTLSAAALPAPKEKVDLRVSVGRPNGKLKTQTKVDTENLEGLTDILGQTFSDMGRFADDDILALTDFYERLSKEGMTPELKSEASKLAEKIHDNMVVHEVDTFSQERLNDLKKALKKERIKLDAFNRMEIEAASGKKYNELRKGYFGNLKLTQDGTPLDTVYNRLRDEGFADILPEADTTYEQWQNIERVIDQGRDPNYGVYTRDFFKGNEDTLANWLADESVMRSVMQEASQRFGGKAPTLTAEGAKAANVPKSVSGQTEAIFQRNTPTEADAVYMKPGFTLRTADNVETPKASELKSDLPTEADTKIEVVKAEPTETPDIAPTRDFGKASLWDRIKNGASKFYKATVDSTNDLTKMGKVVGNDYEAAKQAVRTTSGTTNYIFHNNLVGLDGNALTKADGSTYGSYKDLITQIPENELDDFNTYAAHLHNIDRTNQGKPIWLKEDGTPKYTAPESIAIVRKMSVEHPDFVRYTDAINEWWQAFTHEWLVNTGRISEDEWKALNAMYPNYIPTYRVDKGGVGGAGLGSGKISTGKGYKKAKGGQSTVKRIEDSFAEQIGSMVKAGRRNNLYTEIVGDLKMHPEELKDFGYISTEAGKPSKTGRSIADELDLTADMTKDEYMGLKELKNGNYSVTAYVDGQPITAVVRKDVVDALKLLENAYGSDEAKTAASVGKLITNPMKSAITGLNPIFALANAMRDIPTYLIQSNFPVSTKIASLGKAISGMTGLNPKYAKMLEQYKGLGGKDAGYFAQGKGYTADADGKGLWNTVKNIMSWLGEGTETMPRFAEFISELEKGSGNPLEALQKAADVTVNFSRSGYATKLADGWVMYLNAAAQGLDKFARTAKANPGKTIAKSLAYITAPYALSVAYNWDNPNYQMLSDRIKQNYLVIPKLGGEKDEDGNAKEFIKIPLNREYGAIAGGALNAIAEALAGDENALPTLKGTLGTNFLPPSMVTDNVLAPLAVNLKNGTDFAGRQIVPQYLQGEKPINQQDSKTSGIAKGIATVANKLPINSPLDSPMKVDYLLDSYGGYFGDLAQQATTKGTPTERAQAALVEPLVSKFTTDPRFSSNETQKFYAAKEKATQNKNDSDADMARYKVYTKLSNEMNDLAKQERELLADGGDHEAEIKKLREQRNEIAKSAEKLAEEASKVPTFGTLPSNVQERYSDKSGMSKENWAKMYQTQAQYSTTASKALALLDEGRSPEQIRSVMSISDKELERAQAMKQAGINAKNVQNLYDSTEDKYGRTNKGLIAYEMVGKYDDNYYSGLNISNKKKNAAEKIFNAGWTGEQLNDIIVNADRDKNSYCNKQEIADYIADRWGINSEATAKALYNLLNPSV